MRISKLIAFSILRIVGFRRCPAVSLSNAGSACMVILDLGFSLSRTPLLHEPTHHLAGSSPKPTEPFASSSKPTDTPVGGELAEGNRFADRRRVRRRQPSLFLRARRSQPTRQTAGSSAKATDPPDGGVFGEANCAAAKKFCEASRSP